MSGMRSPTAPANACILALTLAFGGFSGCDAWVPGEHRITSLRMGLISPKEAELGAPGQSVSPSSLRFSVDALDEKGEIFAADASVQAFLVAGGTRLSLQNPCFSDGPQGGDPEWLLSRFDLHLGHAPSVMLPFSAPAIFGRLTLNLEEPESQAQGATPPIFFPNPTITQIVKPLDLSAPNASFCSPYLGRQVIFERSADPKGELIVSSVFQNAVAISDSAASEYGSIYVFTFGRPDTALIKGRILRRVSGAIAKFNGMTQVANPTISATSNQRLDLVPQPIELDAKHRPAQMATAAENRWLTQYIAAPVRITGIVCETDKDQSRHDNWVKYNTVAINQLDKDPESVNGCGGVNSSSYLPPTRFNVQFPGKGVGGFDPATQAGKEVTVTGMLQNSVSKSGKTLYFSVVVRDKSDVCLEPRAMCPNAN